MLIWKASKNENNCQVIKVGKFFPSSKKCHVCGAINKKLKISNRVWECPNCHTVHDRDFNAALNIKGEGLRLGRPEVKSVEKPISFIIAALAVDGAGFDETESEAAMRATDACI
jgi:putative transposase